MPRKPNLDGQRQAIEMRLRGTPLKEVARCLGVSVGSISLWTSGHLPKTEHYDPNFLDRDDELRAYFLGLFMADGWVTAKGPAYLALNDCQIINDLARALKYTLKVQMIPLRKWGGIGLSGKHAYRIGFQGRPAEALREMGFTAQKTGHEFIPSVITPMMFPHFLRGFSDGDGTMGLVQNHGKARLQWGVVSASHDFLTLLLERIRACLGPRVSVGRKKKPHGGWMYRIQLGQKDSVTIGGIMYADQTICLQRKYLTWAQMKATSTANRRWSTHEIEQARLGILPTGRSKAAFYALRRKMALAA